MRPISKHVVSCLVGLACAYCAAWLVSPEEHLPADGLVLLVGDWCPKSLALERQVAEDPELGRRILTLTIDSEREPPECDRVAGIVVDEAPWLQFFDGSWICHRVHMHAAMVFRDRFVALPAWLEGGRPVDPSEARAALERHGLTMCPGPRLLVGEASCTGESGHADEAPELAVEAVERGWNIGL